MQYWVSQNHLIFSKQEAIIEMVESMLASGMADENIISIAKISKEKLEQIKNNIY